MNTAYEPMGWEEEEEGHEAQWEIELGAPPASVMALAYMKHDGTFWARSSGRVESTQLGSFPSLVLAKVAAERAARRQFMTVV